MFSVFNEKSFSLFLHDFSAVLSILVQSFLNIFILKVNFKYFFPLLSQVMFHLCFVYPQIEGRMVLLE